MLGLPASIRNSSGCDERIADLVRELAPAAVWLPTTPVGGTFPFQTDVGVSHYYGVGAYRRPVEDARHSNVRFAAECLAFSNVPEPSTVTGLIGGGERPGTHPRWKARVPRDAGAGWDFEEVRDHYVERLFGVNAVTVRERDAERYLSLGRIASGEAMQRTFAEWRRPGSSCRGGLVWLARDLWPGAGWGIIDSASVPKAAYWHLKRVWAPVALLNADEGLNGLWLHAVNETPEPIAADLRIALYRDGIRLGLDARAALDIPARGSTSVHANALFDGFLDLTYAYRFGPPQHDVVASTIRDRSTGNLLAADYYFPGAIPSESPVDIGLHARAELAGDGYALVLGTERFAHGVAIDIDGFRPDDNYFHLEPGETRRVGLRATARGAIPRGHVTALNGRNPQPILIEETVHAG
jgi:beta-mannosidase